MGGSAPRRDCHLPVETTSFVDRRSELAEGRELLARARLVTLTGPGGVGKTRLAVRIAARVERAFPDGVRFVHLSGLHDPTLVPLAVADALDLHDHSQRPPLDTLVERLRDRRVLLVVDNCEHLLRSCATLAGALLRGTTGVRVLATSRHRLGLTEEHLLDVRPLPVPDPDGELTAADGYPALALFADRAAAVVPGFRLTAANRASVARLCHRLDGLPLAIELAAVRMRVLDVPQLLTRLDDRYRLLATGSPTVPPRHQTLRAAIDWSYELCDPQEQLTWSRLSILPGTFDLETAEAVCEERGNTSPGRAGPTEEATRVPPARPPEPGSAASARAVEPGPAASAGAAGSGHVASAGVAGSGHAASARVVEQGHEVPARAGEAGRDSGAWAGEPGYALPGRVVGAGRGLWAWPGESGRGLGGRGAGTGGVPSGRDGGWVGTGVGVQGAESPGGGEGAEPLGVGRAGAAGASNGDVLEAVAGLVDKSVLCRETGPTGTVRYRLLDTLRHYGLERLRERPGEEHAARVRHRNWMQQQATTAERHWFGPAQPDIVAHLRADRDNLRTALDFSLTTPGESLAGLRLAGTLWFHWHACGAPREGRYWLDRALEANPDPTPERARALWAAGLLAGCPEDLTRGRRRAEQARALAHTLGNPAEAAHADYVVGVIRLFSDDLTGALDHFRAAADRGRVPGQHLSLVGLDRVELACALAFLGRADEAIEVCEQTRRLCAEHGERWVLSYVERILALAHSVRGDWAQAQRHGREAIRLKHAVHDVVGMGLTLDLLARIAAARGAHERAAVLLGGADRAWADVDRDRWGSACLNSTRRTTEERVHEAIGDTAFRRAYETGAALPLTDVVAFELNESTSSSRSRSRKRARTETETETETGANSGDGTGTGQTCGQSRTRRSGRPQPLTDGPPPPGPAIRLTRREAQVAELVAEGLANQQIADRLVIARRTAEGHVERILSKLGFSNRSQIAAWVTAQR
ncbi:ATP-binding protein [Streptomyces sp. NBC_01235]|uniref:ATP-binding protein n=1 Tax=Streptomyces sp. NBC_01235 TaxID=2903788 RepID=UPI002E112F4E|nr:LuxR C-terminal-related transcriptional regulator [Streptomyces sp. NBC_01235]